jgi:hypothetical protein
MPVSLKAVSHNFGSEVIRWKLKPVGCVVGLGTPKGSRKTCPTTQQTAINQLLRK